MNSVNKTAALDPSVVLQPHQQRIADEASRTALRKLLVHGLGSGKSLSSIAAAEAHGQPYTAVVPASLRPNYQKELQRFTDRSLPVDVMSYSQLAMGRQPRYPSSLVFDEYQRIRNPRTSAAQRAMSAADRADQVVLLSGTPVVNSPADLTTALSMLTGKKMTPEEFEDRYVGTKTVQPSWWQRLFGATPGEEPDILHEDELKELLKGKVDYYQPEQPVVPTKYEDHEVEMGLDQSRLYRAMWDKLPFVIRWKLRHDFPFSRDELKRFRAFMTGPRQVGLSTYPYRKDKDPHRAFADSPKLNKAFTLLQERLADPRAKALVFSNFIDAGLVPYAAALQRAGVPHAVFSGKLDDAARKKLVEDYNANKLRVALLGPSGTEGLSFKGTQLVQLLDPAWQPVTGRQAAGRALRYDSHVGLPEDLQNVMVQRFISRLPPGLMEKIKATLLMRAARPGPAADDYLQRIIARKEKLNQRFQDLLREVGTPKEAV